MAGRPSEATMLARRLDREPVLRAAFVEKARLEREIAKLNVFLLVNDELNNDPGLHPADGSITASCGHKLASAEDGVDVIYKGEHCDAIDGFQPCIFYAHFCKTCADQWRADGLLFDNDAVATTWLHQQK